MNASSMEETGRNSLTPAFCGPTANLQQLSPFYHKFQMGDVMWSGRNSTVRACRLRGASKWDYVVKRISRQHIRKLCMEASISREAMALQEFGEHKHVVEMVDFFRDDPDEVFMVFRHLKGGDLFSNIAKQGAMRESDAQRLVASVASALHECHSRNWVHRDLKPENVLCSSHDLMSCDFQLCDFGFACTQDSVTGVREFVGSTGYQAPEVILQHDGASVSPAIDMWGLGCVMFVALTGSMPFFHRDDRMVEQMTVDGVVDLSEDKVGHVSKDAQDVLARLLAYDPLDRLKAGELLEHPWLQDVLPALDGSDSEPEAEPRLESSASFGSFMDSTTTQSSMSRDSSAESLPEHRTSSSFSFIVPPESTVPSSDVPMFTRDQLQRLASEMREFLEVKDRTYHLRTYRKCWLGREGVAYLSKTLGSERVALAVGDQMIHAGLMRHVVGDHTLKNKELFYRFKEDEEALRKQPLDRDWDHVLQSRPMLGGISF